MRSILAALTMAVFAAALPGCGAVRSAQQGFATGFHKGFRSSFRTSFIKGCTGQAGANAALCGCVADELERDNTDDQLMKMAQSDADANKAFADATRACESHPQTTSHAAAEPPADRIGVYVTPYYNSDGPVVNVGTYSAGLASDDESTFVTTIHRMKQRWSDLRFYELYVGAIRLYDLGYRNESVYWFYTAQYRGRQFGMLADPQRLGSIGDPGFELFHAQDAFFQLAGPTINGYAFGDIDRLTGVLQRVERENEHVPNATALYPGVAFIPKSQWAAKNAELAAGLGKLASSLGEKKDQIAEQRRHNGTSTRFASVTSKELPPFK